MRIFLLLLLLVFGSLVLVHAEDDIHRTLDEKLFTLRNGTAFERIEVLDYFGSFREKDVFVARRLQDQIVEILKDTTLDPRVRYGASDAIRKLIVSRVIDKYGISEQLMAVVNSSADHALARAGCVKAMGTLMKVFPNETRNELYLRDLRELLKLPAGENALKVEAIRTLCMLGDATAESVLHYALVDPDLADTAIGSLYDLLSGGGSLKSISVAMKLLDAFANKDISVDTRVKAGECLIYIVKGGTSGNFTLDKVTALLASPTTDARLVVTACKILFVIGNRRSLKPIVDKLADETLTDDTIVNLVQILGDFLRQITPSDEMKKVVNNALYTFGRYMNLRVPAENNRYRYSSRVRRVAAFAAGQVQPGFNVRGAVLLLIDAIDDPDEDVATTSYESLLALTRQDFGKSKEAWKKWFEKANLN